MLEITLHMSTYLTLMTTYNTNKWIIDQNEFKKVVLVVLK